MKLLVLLGLLIVVVFVGLVQSERCDDKDPLACHNLCPINQVHACRNNRCTCKTGQRCLLMSDCNTTCSQTEQHKHCIDGECHCITFDKVDNNED